MATRAVPTHTTPVYISSGGLEIPRHAPIEYGSLTIPKGGKAPEAAGPGVAVSTHGQHASNDDSLGQEDEEAEDDDSDDLPTDMSHGLDPRLMPVDPHTCNGYGSRTRVHIDAHTFSSAPSLRQRRRSHTRMRQTYYDRSPPKTHDHSP